MEDEGVKKEQAAKAPSAPKRNKGEAPSDFLHSSSESAGGGRGGGEGSASGGSGVISGEGGGAGSGFWRGTGSSSLSGGSSSDLYQGLLKYVTRAAQTSENIETEFNAKVRSLETKMRTKLKTAEEELKRIKNEQRKFAQFMEDSKKQLEKTKDEVIRQQQESNLTMKGDIRNEIRDASIKSIEVIGVISSVIALVLVFVNAATNLDDIRNAYYVLVLGTSSLGLFVCILHSLLFREINIWIRWIIVLQVLTFLVLGIVAHIDPWQKVKVQDAVSGYNVNLKMDSGSLVNTNYVNVAPTPTTIESE